MLPPLSNLEVTSEPMMLVYMGKPILVFQMQLNVNLKIMTREEHEGRRKSLHMASVRNTYMELNRDLRSSCAHIKTIKDAPKHKNHGEAELIANRIIQEVDQLIKMQDARTTSWFNNDRNYKTALEEVALMKEMALAKFKWWQTSASVKMANFDQLSMLQVIKYRASKNYHEYCELKNRYSVSRFNLNHDFKITRAEFNRVLNLIGQNVPEHEWPVEAMDKLWKRLLIEDHQGQDGKVGLKWEHMYTVRPKTGTEINNQALSEALQQKLDFAREEWDNFNVSGLSFHTYVMEQHDKYLTPAGGQALSRKEFARLRTVVTSCNGKLYIGADADQIEAESGAKVTLQDELKAAALKVIEAWVDEENLNLQYGVDEDTPLITAASQGDNTEVELYLDAGCELDICNSKGYDAIASAACQGMHDCLAILLMAAHERGLDLEHILEHKNQRGETPLHLASLNGWTDCVVLLMNEGANVLSCSNDGFTPFLSAAEYGHLKILKLLYQHNKDLLFTRNEKLGGWNALHLAAQNGHKHVVCYLLQHGHKELLKMVRFNGSTVLMSAISNGDQGHTPFTWPRRDIVKMFLELYPEMLLREDNAGRSCLHVAAEEDQIMMFIWLVSEIRKRHSLQICADFLLKKDKSEMNCLHKACVKKGSEVFMFLTDSSKLEQECGFFNAPELVLCMLADTCFNNRTCLHLAAGLGKKKIVNRILEIWKKYDLLHLVQV